jgi:hypothetical protein
MERSQLAQPKFPAGAPSKLRLGGIFRDSHDAAETPASPGLVPAFSSGTHRSSVTVNRLRSELNCESFLVPRLDGSLLDKLLSSWNLAT